MAVQFTSQMINGAQQMQEATGIPASVTLAQLILESGYSNPASMSTLAKNYNNFFGVKGSGDAGSVSMSTKEDDGSGNLYSTKSNFAVYSSPEAAFQARGNLLTNSTYSQYFAGAKTVEQYVDALDRSPYATDTSYGSKIMSIIQSNNLTQYDTEYKTYTGSNATEYSGTVTTTGTTATPTGWAANMAVEYIAKPLTTTVFVILLLVVAVVFFMRAFPAIETPTKSITKAAAKAVKGDGE